MDIETKIRKVGKYDLSLIYEEDYHSGAPFFELWASRDGKDFLIDGRFSYSKQNEFNKITEEELNEYYAEFKANEKYELNEVTFRVLLRKKIIEALKNNINQKTVTVEFKVK